MFPLPLHIYFEIAAAVAAILFLKSPLVSKLGWFIPFLILIVGVELTARYMTYELKQPNAWLFNLSVPCEFMFYAFIFREFYHNNFYKKLALYFIIGFFIYSIASMVFISGMKFFDFNLLVVGSACMVLFSVLYFIDYYHHPGDDSIFKNPMFWITTGIFLFNAGEFCYNLLSKILFESEFDNTLEIFRSINHRLVFVLYSSLIIGFICQKISELYKKESVAI